MTAHSPVRLRYLSPPIYPPLPFIENILLDSDFRISMNTAEADFPKGESYFPTKFSKKIEIPYRELMFCAGIAQSPALDPMSFSSWGFMLEHMTSVVMKKGLFRYAAHAALWDIRIKQLFSERLSCGLALWTMWNIDSVVHIADAAPFISRALPKSGPYSKMSLKNLRKYGENGEYKPDYFCLTSARDCVIAECKGTMGSPGVLNKDILKGKEQVGNVRPVGVTVRSSAGQLVFASNLRGEHEKPRKGCDSTLKVVDPEFSPRALETRVNEDEIIRYSYAKSLSLFGWRDLSHSLILGENSEEIIESLPRFVYRDQSKFIALGRSSRYVYGIEARRASELFSRNSYGLSQRLSEIELTREKELALLGELQNRRSVIFPNGIAVIAREELNPEDEVEFFGGSPRNSNSRDRVP